MNFIGLLYFESFVYYLPVLQNMCGGGIDISSRVLYAVRWPWPIIFVGS